MLEGSSAKSGYVMCASLYGRDDSGQTGLEKRMGCFPKGNVLSCHIRWEGNPPATAAMLTLQQQRQQDLRGLKPLFLNFRSYRSLGTWSGWWLWGRFAVATVDLLDAGVTPLWGVFPLASLSSESDMSQRVVLILTCDAATAPGLVHMAPAVVGTCCLGPP